MFMELYDKVLNNKEYLELVKKIEGTRFITDGKWDWEHGLGHYKRVSLYVKEILTQLDANLRTIELGMVAALLHDIGLSSGKKNGHAVRSSELFTKFIDKNDYSDEEIEILRQAIYDHSKGENIKFLIGLALVLADKLDVTYHRTINSSIQDTINKEIQKVKEVTITINDDSLIVNYTTDDTFDVCVLKEWKKAITIPKKVSEYLKRKYIFLINNKEVMYDELLES